MSRPKLAILYLLIVALGTLGVWSASLAVDLADPRRWIGLILLVSAAVVLFLIYRRDLRPTDEENEVEWRRRLKERGRARYLLGQVLSSQIVWLPALVGVATDFFQDGGWRTLSFPPWWYVVLAVLTTPMAFVYSLMWWQRQERKY